MKSAWQVRAGRHGERDQESLAEGLAIAGWGGVPALGRFDTREALKAGLRECYPQRSTYVIGNWAGQLWRFYREMNEGDLVVMPLKNVRQFAIGEVTGAYHYRPGASPDCRHARPVRWLRRDIDPGEFGADLRGSLGSLLTVCRLSRHEAARRIGEVAAGRPDPGWRHASANLDPDATRADLWEAVESGAVPVQLTVRNLLSLWGYRRRTATSQVTVHSELAEHGVTTRPPFTTVRMDTAVELVPIAVEPGATDSEPDSPEAEPGDDLPAKWMVRAILPEKPAIETITAGEPLAAAVTLMLAKDYSQLAVTDDDGFYAGAVSWESIGRARLAKPEPTLRDATTQVRVIDFDDELFGQIDEICSRGYVFVRGGDRRTLVGIVTANDLARQFGMLARPFSLLEEAELRLRRQTKRCVPEDLLDKVAPQWANGNPTFGGYVRLFEDLHHFDMLKWPLDHGAFLDLLKEARRIRNDLMHFSGDEVPKQDLAAIEGFCATIKAVDQSSR
ncbi:CBS domain-containing protein [Amycolatopsis mongoliensis]|uniref:CBS domain-containing protein n=1 Tax=Amycolatopsis mongoliensis TaxID=715475 RepID=A0A9Y2JLD8_9PSEU|nr:CBS domain-containing protein [Amycolatopsis sp. 4-36]WIX99411.1 CBS domain-containing protein [Amycolatopsis sp. 4-36]